MLNPRSLMSFAKVRTVSFDPCIAGFPIPGIFARMLFGTVMMSHLHLSASTRLP